MRGIGLGEIEDFGAFAALGFQRAREPIGMEVPMKAGGEHGLAARSPARKRINSVASSWSHSVTCGIVNAERTIFSAIERRIARTGIRSSSSSGTARNR